MILSSHHLVSQSVYSCLNLWRLLLHRQRWNSKISPVTKIWYPVKIPFLSFIIWRYHGCHDYFSLAKQILVLKFYRCPFNKQNIICPLMNANLIFSLVIHHWIIIILSNGISDNVACEIGRNSYFTSINQRTGFKNWCRPRILNFLLVKEGKKESKEGKHTNHSSFNSSSTEFSLTYRSLFQCKLLVFLNG